MTPEVIAEGRRLEQAVRDADSSTRGWAQEMLRQWAGAHVSELLNAAEKTEEARRLHSVLHDCATTSEHMHTMLKHEHSCAVDAINAWRARAETAENERERAICELRRCDDIAVVAVAAWRTRAEKAEAYASTLTDSERCEFNDLKCLERAFYAKEQCKCGSPMACALMTERDAAISRAEKAEAKLDEMRSIIVEIAKQRGCDDADELIANPSLASPYEGEDDPLVVSLLSQIACAERERDAVLAVLVEVEWCQRVVHHTTRFCPWCGNNSEHPHTAACALDQALRLLRDAANRLDVLKARHIMLQRIETLMGELEEWSEDSEEDLHDAIMRTLDERSVRARKTEDALARARAKLEFAQVVELERDHAQIVEVPDALHRAEKAEQQLKNVGRAIASFGDTFAATRIELEELITELERMTPSSTEGS